jgi:hypothetical protein
MYKDIYKDVIFIYILSFYEMKKEGFFFMTL